MKRLALCLTAVITAIVPEAAAGTASTVSPGVRQFYTKACEAEQTLIPRKFGAEYGIGPHHLYAIRHCVTKMILAPHA